MSGIAKRVLQESIDNYRTYIAHNTKELTDAQERVANLRKVIDEQSAYLLELRAALLLLGD